MPYRPQGAGLGILGLYSSQRLETTVDQLRRVIISSFHFGPPPLPEGSPTCRQIRYLITTHFGNNYYGSSSVQLLELGVSTSTTKRFGRVTVGEMRGGVGGGCRGSHNVKSCKPSSTSFRDCHRGVPYTVISDRVPDACRRPTRQMTLKKDTLESPRAQVGV